MSLGRTVLRGMKENKKNKLVRSEENENRGRGFKKNRR